MAVAVVVTNESEARAMVGWGLHFAAALSDALRVICLDDKENEPREIDIVGDDEPNLSPLARATEHAAQEAVRVRLSREIDGQPAESPPVMIRLVPASSGAAGVLGQLDTVTLLVVSHHEKRAPQELDDLLEMQLYNRAPCDLLLLRPGTSEGYRAENVLVPTAGGPHSTPALKLAAALAEANHGRASALFVEPPIGYDAEDVGRQIVNRIIAKTVGRKGNMNGIVAIHDDYRAGISDVVAKGAFDLLLAGTTTQWAMRKVLFTAIPKHVLEQQSIAIGVMRSALPLGQRVHDRARQVLTEVVPQLERADRITLVEKIQGSSQWNFDFIALIAMSTIIASMGLIQNSGAVVIGAMLVAPLMTPLVGVGLSLVQGNVRLIRNAARSVLLGFLLAFAIALVLGAIVPGVAATDELMARTYPSELDLVIAFVSGLAAAYATSRPNLLGALPGVAIAAALVPPIATAGIMLSIHEPRLAAGALLLFVTNIIAIILGSAVSLFAVGIVADHSHGRSKPWPRRIVGGLLVLTCVLSVVLGYMLYATLPQARVPRRVHEGIVSHVDIQGHGTVTQVAAERRRPHVTLRVTLVAAQPPPATLAEELSQVATVRYGEPVEIRLVTRLEAMGRYAPQP